MDEQMRFIAAVAAGELSMTELCEEFGVSRKAGYKFLQRYCGLRFGSLRSD